MNNVIPIQHGERTFASHHESHGDVVVGAIDICVFESISDIKRLAFSSLLQVITNLGGTLHVKNERLTFISFNQLSEDLLAIAIAIASQLFSNGKIPEPIE